jgi:hypothetical protein
MSNFLCPFNNSFFNHLNGLFLNISSFQTILESDNQVIKRFKTITLNSYHEWPKNSLRKMIEILFNGKNIISNYLSQIN